MSTVKVYVTGRIATFEVELPAKKEVCDRCDGEGTHVKPGIDDNGITGSEMEEAGDEFREAYFGGHFDVRCEQCGGLRVIDVVDEERVSKKMLKRLWKQRQEEAQADADAASERRLMA